MPQAVNLAKSFERIPGPWQPHIAAAVNDCYVKLVKLEGNIVYVRGLDCLDETPLLDIKPDRCEFSPLAAGKDGEGEAE